MTADVLFLLLCLRAEPGTRGMGGGGGGGEGASGGGGTAGGGRGREMVGRGVANISPRGARKRASGCQKFEAEPHQV